MSRASDAFRGRAPSPTAPPRRRRARSLRRGATRAAHTGCISSRRPSENPRTAVTPRRGFAQLRAACVAAPSQPKKTSVPTTVSTSLTAVLPRSLDSPLARARIGTATSSTRRPVRPQPQQPLAPRARRWRTGRQHRHRLRVDRRHPRSWVGNGRPCRTRIAFWSRPIPNRRARLRARNGPPHSLPRRRSASPPRRRSTRPAPARSAARARPRGAARRRPPARRSRTPAPSPRGIRRDPTRNPRFSPNETTSAPAAPGHLGRRVRGAVVDHEDVRFRAAPRAQLGEHRRQVLLLVPGGDEDHRVGP